MTWLRYAAPAAYEGTLQSDALRATGFDMSVTTEDLRTPAGMSKLSFSENTSALFVDPDNAFWESGDLGGRAADTTEWSSCSDDGLAGGGRG
jgi:hypothetical protein